MKKILLFVFLLLSVQIQAQPKVYHSATPGYPLATSDSRLAATIVETDSSVTFQVIMVGEANTDAIEWSFFFKPDVLVLTDRTFTQDLSTYLGIASKEMLPQLFEAVTIAPELVAKGWTIFVMNQREACAGGFNCSCRAGMRAIIASVVKNMSTPATILSVPAGAVKPIYECYFKKVRHGAPLQTSDIGVGVKSNLAGGRFQPGWAYGEGLSYAFDPTSSGEIVIAPELFSFRSPASINTGSAQARSATEATLAATFKRGNLAPVNNIINTTGTTATGTGKLEWDAVTQSGFIYTASDVDITVRQYTDTMLINGKPYLFPNDKEIAAGTFTRGEITFYVKTGTDNSSRNAAQSVNYELSLKSLNAKTTFFAWAFMKYTILTSKPYPAVGEKTRFTTR